nr:metalloregulator ArsR/SmtB family transcription factor [Aquibacillus kalidii]
MNNEWLFTHVHMVYSPFREMITSLHVLAAPCHHLARKQWAEETLDAFSNEMKEALFYFSDVTSQWFNFLDLIDYLNIQEKHVEEAIEQLTQVDDRLFTRFMLGAYDERDPHTRTEHEQLVIEKPSYIKRQLIDFLYDYHMKFFARELFRIEPWLIKAVHELKEKFNEEPINALDTVHPRFEVNRSGLAFYKAETYRFPWDQITSLAVYPSTFIAPHLLVGLETSDITVYLHVSSPHQSEEIDQVPTDLLELMKALAEPTRLRMVRKLLYHSYCTQQLVDEFQLAKATISKHLKILEQSKIISSNRQGHYVFYQTDLDRLTMLRVDLDQFFDQPLLKKEE